MVRGLLVLGVGVLLTLTILVFAALFARCKAPLLWKWLKDLIIPLVTPVAVLLMGSLFAIQSEQRAHSERQASEQRNEAERRESEQRALIERQTSIMREMMASGDRRDTSSLIAVDTQLRMHLQRYENCRQENKETKFDEEAAFFFYGMHRAALINLHATKGNIVFPRLWMEDAFEDTATHVVTLFLGGDERDPAVSPEAEAVIYEYFGTAPEAGRVVGEHAGHLGARPLLLHFHQLLENKQNLSDRIAANEVKILKREFRKFQEQLKNQEIREEVILALVAMNDLVGYAYNSLFAKWYGVDLKEIPTAPPCDLPLELFSASQTEVSKEEQAVHQEAWKLMGKVCGWKCK
jgi:hypothetical protein